MVAAATAAPARAQDNKPTLAIVDFDQTPGGWTLPPPQLGSTVAQLMLDQLVSAEKFRVLDGQWLQYGSKEAGNRRFEVLRENADRAGVDYLVLGSITKFSNENHQRTVGGGGLRIPFIGGVRRQKAELAISILVRVVDVRSGEVIATTSGQGNGSRKNVGVGALGLIGGPVGAIVSTAVSQARDAQLDEAVQQAVVAASAALVNAAPRLIRGRTETSPEPPAGTETTPDTLALARE
jgi:curli biogenesis system outer membrane secretion channel CsgG